MDKISEESKHQKDKEELLKSKIKDKIKIAQNKNRYMDTDFLDLREQEIIKNEIIKFNTNQMQMQADKNINVNAKEKVSFESSLIDYKTEN